MIIETERLLLRPFEDRDRAPFADLNADPEVMRFFPKTQTQDESDALIERIETRRSNTGLCFLAAELKATNQCIGFIGMSKMPDDLRNAIGCTAEVEIGWRLSSAVWGQGLAPEGAQACLSYGWEHLKLSEIVAFTVTPNTPSQRVMQKIGMSETGTFDHPAITDGHPLQRHILYSISNPELA